MSDAFELRMYRDVYAPGAALTLPLRAAHRVIYVFSGADHGSRRLSALSADDGLYAKSAMPVLAGPAGAVVWRYRNRGARMQRRAWRTAPSLRPAVVRPFDDDRTCVMQLKIGCYGLIALHSRLEATRFAIPIAALVFGVSSRVISGLMQRAHPTIWRWGAVV